MSLIVVVLLVIALMAALLAAALAMGILEFRAPGGGQAVVSPTPGQVATEAPTESPDPSPEPSPEPATAAPATPAPAPGEATAQPSPGGVHVVQAGESLFSIGQLYGVPWGEIAAANEIENPDLLSVGQELIIPVAASFSPPPGVHVVQTGESISSIAELYDVTPTDLAEANGIENWDLIFVGQQLNIPGRAPARSPSPEP
jgi:LysM repeat protein